MIERKNVYTLDELIDSQIEETPPLITGLLYEQDNIIVLGDAKIGKSLLSMQMAFSLTAGTHFLDNFPVKRPCKVAYVQAEGKMFETFSRTKKMTKEVPHKRGNLIWVYLPMVPMDRPESATEFLKLLGDFQPDVIFLDPLYMLASTGSLKDDDVATKIVGALNRIKAHYGCALVINHHQHRAKMTQTGDIIEEGDNSIFGSFVWKAWPDAVLLFDKVKNQLDVRKLSCDTQRSNTVVKELKLILTQPDPLYFEVLEDMTATEHMVYKLIEKNTVMTIANINDITNLAESTIYKAIRRLKKVGKVIELEKRGTYSVKLT